MLLHGKNVCLSWSGVLDSASSSSRLSTVLLLRLASSRDMPARSEVSSTLLLTTLSRMEEMERKASSKLEMLDLMLISSDLRPGPASSRAS